MSKPTLTTTDALRAAGYAVKQAADALNVYPDLRAKVREMAAIGEAMISAAGDEGSGNQSCRIDITF